VLAVLLGLNAVPAAAVCREFYMLLLLAVAFSYLMLLLADCSSSSCYNVTSTLTSGVQFGKQASFVRLPSSRA
jgi:hypothetical protein